MQGDKMEKTSTVSTSTFAAGCSPSPRGFPVWRVDNQQTSSPSHERARELLSLESDAIVTTSFRQWGVNIDLANCRPGLGYRLRDAAFAFGRPQLRLIGYCATRINK